MPCWYFEKTELSKTPSAIDGIDNLTETRYRCEGVKLMIDVGSALGLRYDVCATAAVYFHRFYMFHSFQDFHRYVTASTCLFLAAKLEENTVTWTSLKDTVKSLLTQLQFTVFGPDPEEEVMAVEKILLETLKFDLVVDLPYNHLLKFIKLLKGEPSTIEQLLKMSWTFINDCLCTTLCIQWEPELVALSLLYLSCHLIKFPVTDWIGKPADYNGKWYQYLVNDINLGIIENICRQALGVYTKNRQQVATDSLAPSRVRRRSKSRSVSPRIVIESSPEHDNVTSQTSKGDKYQSPIRRKRSSSSSPRRLNPNRRSRKHSESSERDGSVKHLRRRSPTPDRRRHRSSSVSSLDDSRRRRRTAAERGSRSRSRKRDSSDDRRETDFEFRRRQCLAILHSGKMLSKEQFDLVQSFMHRESSDSFSQEQFESLKRSLDIESDHCSGLDISRSRESLMDPNRREVDEPYVPESFSDLRYVSSASAYHHHHPPPPPMPASLYVSSAHPLAPQPPQIRYNIVSHAPPLHHQLAPSHQVLEPEYRQFVRLPMHHVGPVSFCTPDHAPRPSQYYISTQQPLEAGPPQGLVHHPGFSQPVYNQPVQQAPYIPTMTRTWLPP